MASSMMQSVARNCIVQWKAQFMLKSRARINAHVFGQKSGLCCCSLHVTSRQSNFSCSASLECHRVPAISTATVLQTLKPITPVSLNASPLLQAPRRHFHIPNPFKKRYNFRPLDGVPASYEMVYKNTMNTYVVFGYPMAAIGTAVCIFQTLLFVVNMYNATAYFDFLGQSVFQGKIDLVIMVTVAAGVTWLMRVMAQRCILRIYYDANEQKFLAVSATLFPWKVEKLSFDSGAFKCLYPHDSQTTMRREFFGEYTLSGRRYMLYPHHFKLPYYFNQMLGYNK